VNANPDADVEVRERSEPRTYINDHFAGYAAYQSKFTRTIPVIALEAYRT
jgi:hypothetical protein